MQQGVILKGYSGFYYVKTKDSIVECSLRGRNKKLAKDFYPGDVVWISLENERQGAVERAEPRKSFLLRPPVANVTLLVIVMSLGYPEAELTLLDRLTVLAEHAGIRPVVVLSKLDTSNRKRVGQIMQDYKNTGYRFIATSTKTMEGIDTLKNELVGETTVFAGQSGAGKTSLMNLLMPEKNLRTGVLGEKSRRGKHTTRHIELFPYHGGYLVDTPGFNRLYVPEMEESQLQYLFPEFAPYLAGCRFSSCLHYKEPDCAVKEHVDNGVISKKRYESYIQFLEEIKNKEKRYND